MCADLVVRRLSLMPYDVHSRVQHLSLLQCSPKRPMQAVLEIELAVPVDNMGEQVSIEGGVLIKQSRQIEGVLGRGELI